jgi:hypothetical protein
MLAIMASFPVIEADIFCPWLHAIAFGTIIEVYRTKKKGEPL